MVQEHDWAAEPVVVVVAPTGAEATRDDNPALPHTPAEIADAVIEAAGAGATVAHLHVREPDGTPSSRPELFAETIERVRAASDVITMVSTGGAVGTPLEERLAGLRPLPDMAGIEVGSVNFGEDLFATLPHETRAIAAAAADAGIALEVEAFELGHLDTARALLAAGTLPEPLRVNIVLGVPGALAATAHNLHAMATAVPAGVPWGVTAVGRHQRRMLSLALLLGASCVRVGFEDNVYLDKGVLAASNAALVEQVASIAAALGRRVATPEEARRILAVPSRAAA
ncbi:MAG TPA: 3-keto-5-aminohexanoate cleavage protein [Baekduia sp.]|nr:3-keto-5-aminohexanoate cleavage protein [Baekduia sp.]